MANVNTTAASGSVRNCYTDDVDLVFVGPIAFAASGDTVTIQDAEEVTWAMPCVMDSGSDIESGTCMIDYSAGSGRINITNAKTGSAYIMAVVKRTDA